jgi:ATPase subunit of ABC transporter with duplicated ATPase domains
VNDYSSSTGSRVGVVGPNGAGKSTLIKLLTVGDEYPSPISPPHSHVGQGEIAPQEGTVYKHPALRLAYVSQHVTHHIGPPSSIRVVIVTDLRLSIMLLQSVTLRRLQSRICTYSIVNVQIH